MSDKFHFMSKLSDKLPVILIPVEVPCQRVSVCENMTSQAMWFMHLGTWYLKPTCPSCIVESGHQPLDEDEEKGEN